MKFYSCLRALCNWLYRNDYLEKNPIDKVEAPKTEKHLLSWVSPEQLKVLIDHAHCERDKAILSLLWHSGMRLSESARVQASDFDWNTGKVIALGKGKREAAHLAGDAIVKAWFEQHSTWEISKRGIEIMLKRLGKETGIHCNAHAFRRGMCVYNLKLGLSNRAVQELGAWQNPAMVARYSRNGFDFDDVLELQRKAMNSLNDVSSDARL